MNDYNMNYVNFYKQIYNLIKKFLLEKELLSKDIIHLKDNKMIKQFIQLIEYFYKKYVK